MLIDTSTLLRTIQIRSPEHETATRALEILGQQGRSLHIVSQNLVELWVVATRPLQQNGLGMSPPEVATELRRIKNMLDLLPDNADVHPNWERLVTEYRVVGKPAHDARLVAAMIVHGLTSIVTFDRTGFSRYEGIEAVHPADIVSSPTERS